jgi:hypothetical protein
MGRSLICESSLVNDVKTAIILNNRVYNTIYVTNKMLWQG